MKLYAKDCSPLPDAKGWEEWLCKLARNTRSSDCVMPLSGARDEDESVVYCAWDGSWWAGRYIGSISFEGRTLVIVPRFGLETLRNWLSVATSLVLTDTPGRLRQDDAFIIPLLASVWVHGLIDAARHGLPALRRDVPLRGSVVRGRLDVSASLRLIAAREKEVISVHSEKSLDHAASNAIVAAYGVLQRGLGGRNESWLPKRARELLPHFLATTGPRPRVPTKTELERIRYTPITAGFAAIAELSRQIANQQGLVADAEDAGETRGVLLDVAEIWELYVLKILENAVAPIKVRHGTREKSTSRKLLWSDVAHKGIGNLFPDAILEEQGEVRGVVDAKYKSLYPTRTAPYGPQREDLYQMTTYLARYASNSDAVSWGLLAYPEDPERPNPPIAEQGNPWHLEAAKKMVFTTLPHTPDDAVKKIRSIFSLQLAK